MRRPCRSHARDVFASPYVDTLDDAVFVVEASVGGVAAFGAVALLLDGDDRLLTAIECPGCDTAAGVADLCAVLVMGATPAGSWRRLVVATSFDAPVEAWSSLVDVVGRSPVALVDWLAVDVRSAAVRSLREAAEGRSPW